MVRGQWGQRSQAGEAEKRVWERKMSTRMQKACNSMHIDGRPCRITKAFILLQLIPANYEQWHQTRHGLLRAEDFIALSFWSKCNTEDKRWSSEQKCREKKRFFKNIAIKKKKLAIEKTAKNCNESTFDTAGHTYSIIKIRKHHHDDSIDRHHG